MKYLFLIILVSCKNYCPLPASKIVSVGGCDRYGSCGVMLENGNVAEVNKPVVGAKFVKYIKCDKEQRQ